MKIFNDKKAEKAFISFRKSFKTSTGRNKFIDVVGLAFLEKQKSTHDLSTFKLTTKEIESMYFIVKKLYV